MNKKVFLIFSLALGYLFLVVMGVDAAPWGTEGVGGQPSGGSVCDHHDSSGSCSPYVFQAFVDGQPAQAWQGHFSAEFLGTAGFFGPGRAKVYGCLTYSPSMWNGACFLLYQR